MSITSWKITISFETLYRRSPSHKGFFITSMNSRLVKRADLGALRTD